MSGVDRSTHQRRLDKRQVRKKIVALEEAQLSQ